MFIELVLHSLQSRVEGECLPFYTVEIKEGRYILEKVAYKWGSIQTSLFSRSVLLTMRQLLKAALSIRCNV